MVLIFAENKAVNIGLVGAKRLRNFSHFQILVILAHFCLCQLIYFRLVRTSPSQI
jgi:hypothetical protein